MNTTELIYNEQTDSFVEQQETQNPFILGSTSSIELNDLEQNYLTPVYAKDCSEVISHGNFIRTLLAAVKAHFPNETVAEPKIRVSHQLMMRNQSGVGKLIEQLDDLDTSSYFQRLITMIEIPSIKQNVNGNELNLQVVAIHSFHELNLLGSSNQRQNITMGIGFVNSVCTNLCLSTDGVNSTIKVYNTDELYKYALELFGQYNPARHLEQMRLLRETKMNTSTFSQFLGKCRLYAAMPQSLKIELNLPEVTLLEAQLNSACRDYFENSNFKADENGDLTMWNFYNILTNFKNSPIVPFIDRSVNIFDVAVGVSRAINGTDNSWSWFIE